MNYPLNTTFSAIPIVNVTTYVVNQVIEGKLVPLFEHGDYLVALGKYLQLTKKYPFPYKFRMTAK